MSVFFQKVIDWINALAGFFMDGINWFLEKVQALFFDTLSYFLDLILSMITSLLTGFDLFDQLLLEAAGLPNDVQFVMNALNIPSAFAVIMGAYLLKISLRLIPGL